MSQVDYEQAIALLRRCEEGFSAFIHGRKLARRERDALRADLQSFLQRATVPEPLADGWIAWNGGECPLEAGVAFQVKFRGRYVSAVGFCTPGLRWSHNGGASDIVAYRVVEGGGV
jgi:hypothetical protein